MIADFVLTYEKLLRPGSFFILLTLFILLELWCPFRLPPKYRANHYVKNLSLILLSSLLIHLAFPIVAVGVSVWSEHHGIGLFNQFEISSGWRLFGTWLALDFVIYFQHRAFHSWPLLWRLHRVHHSDPHYDTTTGIRFHPLEMILSMLIKIATVVALGANPTGVVLFEIILNASSLFSHLNFALPEKWDRLIRKVFVTPGMHRVHHSVNMNEMNSCFGFNLSIWDYIFKTYRSRPLREQKSMEIGVNRFGDDSLVALLKQPFVSL